MNQLVFLVFAVMFTCFVVDTVSTPAKRNGQFKGRATFYSPGLGSCGITNSAQDFVVALNVAQYTNNDDVCNKAVSITGPKGTVRCIIIDKCPGCSFGCLDLSPAAFNKIGDEAAGVIDITWSFVDNKEPPAEPHKPTKTTESISTTTKHSSTHTTSSATSTTEEIPTTTSTSGEIMLTDVMSNFFNGSVAGYDPDTNTSMAHPSSSDTLSPTSTP